MKKLNYILDLGMLIFILINSSLAQSSQETNNWPQFRSVNCTGIAADNVKPPIEFNEKNLIWKTELPVGYSSPCIWGDNIFVTGYLQDEKKLEMICIDLKDGKISWQHSLSVEKFEKVSSLGNVAQPTPATDGKRVYFYFGSYGLQCYDVAGKFQWEERFPIADSRYGSASSPILYNDMLILCRDVIGDGKLYAFNKENGNTIWVADLPERPEQFNYPSFSTPIIWNNCIVIHRMWQSTAHSLKDGSLKWLIPIPTNGNSTPVFNKDVLFFGAWHEFSEEDQRGELPDFNTMIAKFDGDNDGLIKRSEIPSDMVLFDRPGNDLQKPWYLRSFFGRFDINKDGLINYEEWIEGIEFIKSYSLDGGLFAIRPMGSGELPITNIIWKVTDKVPEVPSPLYYNNFVYMCKDGGILTCIDAYNGKIVYRERIGAIGSFIASPVAANGYIYFTSAKGVITVIKAGDKLDIVKQSNLKENVFATPAIVGNSVYIRTEGHLYAFK